MEILTKKIKLSKIKANPNNPRIIRDDKFKKLVKSLKDFPKMMELRPIIVDENNIIQGGNMRYKALKELGYTEVSESWVKQAKDFTAEELKEFIIKDNVGFGDWDWDELANEWDQEELNDWGLDTPDEWGSEEVPPKEGQDDVPELKKEPFVVRGDIFEIKAQGLKYRIGCLDSTCIDDVNKLLDGNNMDLVFTDPPYGIAYTGKGQSGNTKANDFGEIKGDGDIKVAQEAYNLIQSLEIENQIWWGANFYCDILKNQNSWLVWDKETVGKNYSDCELAYTTRKGRIIKFTHQWHGMIKASEQGQRRVHPTQKPIELAKFCFELFDDVSCVLDLFAGSGSTLIACIKTKRNCFTCDIDEYYTQVIVKRAVEFLQNNNIDFKIQLNGETLDVNKLI